MKGNTALNLQFRFYGSFVFHLAVSQLLCPGWRGCWQSRESRFPAD